MIVALESNSPEETFKIGEMTGKMAGAGDIYCLNGDLGAGKTVFAKGVASGLGVKGRVASPTFTIINEHQGRLPFYHMDAYRLGGPEELADLGCEEYFYGQGVTLVEWAEIISEELPAERLEINITGEGEEPRNIEMKPYGYRYYRMVEELSRHVHSGS
ncbi:MAG: tRNA (adenosine(37)-N6)-threonylcarbamoyltransferase complex ATPase subunit type 1 TsaE [Bacillota bacterium]